MLRRKKWGGLNGIEGAVLFNDGQQLDKVRRLGLKFVLPDQTELS